MRCAEVLATRSTCARNAVGAVVTDKDMLQALGIGYNGNARGLPNGCDAPTSPCGCVHAEMNALLKAPGIMQGKRLFTTVAPCGPCAKACINAGIEIVYFRTPYRYSAGVTLLLQAGIKVIHLPGGLRSPRTIRDARQVEDPTVGM